MLIHIFDVHHGCALGAFTNIPTAVSLMQIDFIDGKLLQAVSALLVLSLPFQPLFLHFNNNVLLIKAPLFFNSNLSYYYIQHLPCLNSQNEIYVYFLLSSVRLDLR